MDNEYIILRKILENTEAELAGNNIVFINDGFVKDGNYQKYDMTVIQKTERRLNSLLNKHNKSRVFGNDEQVKQALLNRNVINAYDILTNPINFISCSEPIDSALDELKDIAKESTLGGREKTLTMWQPMTKAIMQDQFMIGKKEIGIIATAIKTYLGKSAVINEQVEYAAKQIENGNVADGLNIISKYVFTMKFGSDQIHMCLLANINLDHLKRIASVTPVLRASVIPQKLTETPF